MICRSHEISVAETQNIYIQFENDYGFDTLHNIEEKKSNEKQISKSNQTLLILLHWNVKYKTATNK